MSSLTLSEEEKARYIPLIDAILKASDLSTISVKKVRNGLSTQTGVDFAPFKKSIDTVITERFDILLAERDNPPAAAPPPEEQEPATAPVKQEPIKKEYVVLQSTAGPPGTVAAAASSSPDLFTSPKKRKSSSVVSEDARIAAELHAQLNGGRPSRGGATKPPRKPPAKKRAKKKSKDVVSSDVSDAEGGGEAPVKKKRRANPNNAFMKPLILSEPLAAFIGEAQMSRPEVVKKIWDYVKSHGLQDPSDRRYIICDDSLKPVFGDKVHMFTMNKVLALNMYKAEEVAKPQTQSV